MRIERLVLREVACFDHLEIAFPEGSDPSRADIQVLVGDNGTGKSTILRALAQFFTDEDTGLAERVRGASSLARLQTDRQTDEWLGEDFRFWKPTRVKAAPYRQEIGAPLAFAAFGYSGQRSIGSSRLLAIQELQDEPLRGALTFEAPLTASLMQWIANIRAKEAFALQRGEQTKAAGYRETLSRLERAVSTVTGPLSFEITDPLDVVVRFRGANVPFGLLPDGVKSILSWLGDLLMRLDRIPWVDNLPVLERPFALFLDEIEVHLHPKWQWKVVPMLQTLFPKAQVFLATHSPFVVASASDAWIHRLELTSSGTVTAKPPLSSRIGQSYEAVLAEVLGVRQLFDPETQAALDEFYVLRDRALAGEPVLEELEARASSLQGRSAEVEAIVGPELRNVRRQAQAR